MTPCGGQEKPLSPIGEIGVGGRKADRSVQGPFGHLVSPICERQIAHRRSDEEVVRRRRSGRSCTAKTHAPRAFEVRGRSHLLDHKTSTNPVATTNSRASSHPPDRTRSCNTTHRWVPRR